MDPNMREIEYKLMFERSLIKEGKKNTRKNKRSVTAFRNRMGGKDYYMLDPSPEYIVYDKIMKDIEKIDHKEWELKIVTNESNKRKFKKIRHQKTGTTPSIIHRLKNALHSHNKFDKICAKIEQDAAAGNEIAIMLQEALSMGHSVTIDAYIISGLKSGVLRRDHDKVEQAIQYVYEKLACILKEELEELSPDFEICNENGLSSVIFGIDYERIMMCAGGVARVDPMTEEYSRHTISPITSSAERLNRMSEALFDAVNLDIQDIGLLKKEREVEKKAVSSLKELIRQIRNDAISANLLITEKDLKQKIKPLLSVIDNNQHPGVQTDQNHFERILKEIEEEEEEKNNNNNNNTDKVSSEQSGVSSLTSLTTQRPQPVTWSVENNILTPEVIEVMSNVPIIYTNPENKKTIEIGRRIVQGTDDLGNYFEPVPLGELPVVFTTDETEKLRMVRALRKMTDASRTNPDEYHEFFGQSMAPKEPFIDNLYKHVANERNNKRKNKKTTPRKRSRLNIPVRTISFGEERKRKGTSIPNAINEISKIRLQERIKKEKDDKEYDDARVCPELPNYREDKEQDEDGTHTSEDDDDDDDDGDDDDGDDDAEDLCMERKSCIVHLVRQERERMKNFGWMASAYAHDKANLREVLKNPLAYQGTNGEGPLGTGSPARRDYIAEFLREPVGHERPCRRGDMCIGLIIPKIQWPETKDVCSKNSGFILREFFRPDDLKKIMEVRKYPEIVNPCVLCIDYITTQTMYSFISNGSSPECVVPFYSILLHPKYGYNRRVIIPMYTSKKSIPTGVLAPCKMFRHQDYYLGTTICRVKNRDVVVKCYKERTYTEDEIHSDGIDRLTLDGQPIDNEDFYRASVVSVNL